MPTIRNPIEWTAEQVAAAARHLGAIGEYVHGHDETKPVINPLTSEDLRAAIHAGVEDFAASRSDAGFICLIYPFAGLILVWAAFDYALLPLIFPLMAGFALLGPVAAVGLYAMSRTRARDGSAGWSDAVAVIGSPSFGAILVLGLGLAAVFLVWLGVAKGLYDATLGPEPPASIGQFMSDVLLTGAGWAMTVLGFAVGFVFAAFVLALSIVSFPMLVDRNVGIRRAVETSLKVTARNPREIALWGLIVALALVLGSLPLLLGLIFVMPVLGHATWHLYTRAVSHPDSGVTG